MANAVLDASALLAFLFDEHGADVVTWALGEGACISSVNLSEVLSVLVDRGIEVEDALSDLSDAGLLEAIEVVDFDLEAASDAARLRGISRAFGLSLGDRACLALAKSRDLPAVTADKRWASLKGVEVRVIR